MRNLKVGLVQTLVIPETKQNDSWIERLFIQFSYCCLKESDQRQTNKELAYKNTAAIMFEDKDTTTNTSVILL